MLKLITLLAVLKGEIMSIAIVNVSSENTTTTGINQYEVRINSEVICKFEHDRKYNGLPQCLRDAADAVDKTVKLERAEILTKLIELSQK